MFKENHKSAGKPKNSTAKKSSVEYVEFEFRIRASGLTTADFIRFSGIARSTMHGWKKSGECIPLYALRNLELFEIKNELKSIYTKLV